MRTKRSRDFIKTLVGGRKHLCVLVGLLVFIGGQGFTEDLPKLPGANPDAQAIGLQKCEACHEDVVKNFKGDPHALIDVPKTIGEKIPLNACESCHGEGSLHEADETAKGAILRESPDRCLSCHLDIKGKFSLQHHHPVPEGRMNCSDCHGFHGTKAQTKMVADLKRDDETCFKCHKETKGPFVFEHEAMREGCQSCHNPHGSVQDKLLVAGQDTTCLRCHYDINTNPSGNLSGGVAHGSTPSTTGAKGGNFDIGRGESCVDHHRAAHGSNIWRTFNR